MKKPGPKKHSANSSRPDRLTVILDVLNNEYKDRGPLLEFRNPFELLAAVSLSAQTTDAAVNRVTPELFRRWPDPESLSGADSVELEELVHPLGFFRQKARNLIAASRMLVEDYGSTVPENMDELTSLPGIGRKSANVIRSHVWKLPAIIVDTHFGRVCRRLGLTEETDPDKVEHAMQVFIPAARWSEFSMTANLHGRRYCMSRKPDCGACPLEGLCPKIGVTENPEAGIPG
jgi:endonuclease-3